MSSFLTFSISTTGTHSTSIETFVKNYTANALLSSYFYFLSLHGLGRLWHGLYFWRRAVPNWLIILLILVSCLYSLQALQVGVFDDWMSTGKGGAYTKSYSTVLWLIFINRKLIIYEYNRIKWKNIDIIHLNVCLQWVGAKSREWGQCHQVQVSHYEWQS